MDIGGNIKRLRIAHNFTQGELAKKVGIAQAQLCQIERGTRTVSLPLSKEIADVFGCTTDDLIKDKASAKEEADRAAVWRRWKSEKKLVLKIGEKYYFSEIGGFFNLKIYGISKANFPTERFQDIVDFKIVENKTYSLKEHILFWISLLKDRFKLRLKT